MTIEQQAQLLSLIEAHSIYHAMCSRHLEKASEALTGSNELNEEYESWKTFEAIRNEKMDAIKSILATV